MSNQRPFESGAVALFDAQARAASAEAWYRQHFPVAEGDTRHASATVVHVFKAGCPCNRFTEPHLAKIISRYRQEGVRFAAATRAPSARPVAIRTSAGEVPAFTIPEQTDLDWLDETPAALVYDAGGKLVYFGPYSSAAWCGTSGGLVERVLDRALGGQAPKLQPFYGSGCFCPMRAQAAEHG